MAITSSSSRCWLSRPGKPLQILHYADPYDVPHLSGVPWRLIFIITILISNWILAQSLVKVSHLEIVGSFCYNSHVTQVQSSVRGCASSKHFRYGGHFVLTPMWHKSSPVYVAVHRQNTSDMEVNLVRTLILASRLLWMQILYYYQQK